MKKLISTLALSFVALFSLAALASAQDRGSNKARPSPNAAVSQTIGTTVVSITYGRPGLKGRTLESLAPQGKVWRTGANEATAITFSNDANIGGKEVKAGTYSLYTIPSDEEWTIIINKKLSWGTQYDASQDLVRVKAATSKCPQTERFTIGFDTLSDTKAHLNLSWGDVTAAVPITVK